jgi:hypothetical protein
MVSSFDDAFQFFYPRRRRGSVRSPTGMHGLSMAFRIAHRLPLCSPLPLLGGLGSTRQGPSAFPDRSQLPRSDLSLPRRDSPSSGSPRRDQSSRPTSSVVPPNLPCQTVRLAAPRLMWFPTGALRRASPIAERLGSLPSPKPVSGRMNPAVPNFHRPSAPRRDFRPFGS